ncbi:MAG: hypothetical protein GY723_15125 [bacterium]|nr:hypothetical protein [bacterium]
MCRAVLCTGDRWNLEVDLLDFRSLSPFLVKRVANAGYWFVGSALASFVMASDANIWIVGLVIPAMHSPLHSGRQQ